MFQPRHAIVVSVVALLMTGIVMVTSAGLSLDPSRQVTLASILLSRTTIYALTAVAFLAIGAHVDVSRLVSPDWARRRIADGMAHPTRHDATSLRSVLLHPATALLGVIVALLLLVHVPGIGATKNGAARWIEITLGSVEISMQPSEVAKWGLVLVLPVYALHIGMARIRRFWTGFLPLLFVLLAVCGMIITEDLGTAVLIGAVGLLVLFAAGVRWWHIAILGPIPAAGIVLAILSSPYRIERLRAFVNPYADPQGEGYHMIQSMVAIANGHVTGRGLGHGVFKFGYLPEDTTDFLFAIICEELGVAGAALVLFLYIVLLISGFCILRRLSSATAKLMALGIILTLGLQTVINLFVVTGMAPTKGIALPLLSAGGTGWILTAFSLGLLIGMDRYEERRQLTNNEAASSRREDGSDEEVERPYPVVSISATNSAVSRSATAHV